MAVFHFDDEIGKEFAWGFWQPEPALVLVLGAADPSLYVGVRVDAGRALELFAVAGAFLTDNLSVVTTWRLRSLALAGL
jgi:hypothetical protein